MRRSRVELFHDSNFIFNLDDFKGPAGSFEDSLLPVKNLLSISDDFIHGIKQICYKRDDKTLSNDESAAIFLYTMNESSSRLSSRLNGALLSRDHQKVEPWKKFLRLFLCALNKIPDWNGMMWFEPTHEFAQEIRTHDRFSCVSFISGTLTRNDLLVSSKNNTHSICCAELFHGKNIQKFSSSQSQAPILLIPGTHLRLMHKVQGITSKTYFLHLKEEIYTETIHRNNRSTSQLSEQSQQSRIVSRQMHTEIDDSTLVKLLYRNPYSVTTFNNGDRYEIRYGSRGEELFVTLFTSAGEPFSDGLARQLANGKGTCTWSNGDRYQGTIRNGRMHGNGELKCANGYSYVGVWCAGKAHGQGISKWPNGHCYEGSHQDGNLTGWGQFRTAKNDIYHGCLVEGKAQGDGERIWPNGNRYSGEFRDDKKHGEGRFTFANRGFYVGNWLNDEMDGYGELRWPSGNKYLGEFKRGQLNGQGKIIFTNGEIQAGIWRKGRLIQRTG